MLLTCKSADNGIAVDIVVYAGAGAVVRDLFKSHFRSLRGVKPPEAAEEADDCLTVQQDRHSFTAR